MSKRIRIKENVKEKTNKILNIKKKSDSAIERMVLTLEIAQKRRKRKAKKEQGM